MSRANERHTFKRTTIDNWLQPDPLMAVLVKRDRRDGSVLPVDPADWVRYANRLRLPASVPVEVRDAFEFALCGRLRLFLLSDIYARLPAGAARS